MDLFNYVCEQGMLLSHAWWLGFQPGLKVVEVVGDGGWHACGKERQSKKRNTVPIGTGHPARPDLAALVPPFHP